jgi:chondroitin AC lyase
MRKLFILLVLSLANVYSAKAQVHHHEADELTKIRAVCRQLLLSERPYATEQSYLLTDDVVYELDGDGYFNSLTAVGKWDDIDYTVKTGSAWPQSWHLYRLLLVTRSYYKNHNPAYLTAIHQALQFWINNDFQCPNWWQNQINIPYVFSSLMLMLASDAKQSELDFLTKVLAKRVVQDKPTGQNKIWQHDAEARIALITEDGAAFKNAISQMQSVIKISKAEGIQPDYSFQQHGTMLQFGNYGIHFVNSLLFWIKVNLKSAYAFDKDLQQIVVDYCTEGLRYTIFKKGMDMVAIGRQLKINSAVRRGEILYHNFSLIKSLNIGKAKNYNLDGFSIKSPKLELNKSFWRSAYMVQTDGGKSMISVKMQGRFVRPIESINFENLQGSLLNDGVTLIQRTGREYRNIEPLWKWTMLPGITTDTTINPAAETSFKAKNMVQLIGQVSNGNIGIASMDYRRLGIEANKSYFFVKGMMVALGSKINAPQKKDLVTTINQTFVNNKPIINGKNDNGKQWLWHDSIAYVLLEPSQDLKINVERKQGRWTDVDRVSSAKTISDNLFTAYLTHESTSSYSYLVRPNVSLAETKAMVNKPSVELYSNTPALHAVRIATSYLLVFYEPGSIAFSPSLKFSVDHPCLVIYDHNRIWVSDPTRNEKQVSLTINGKLIICPFPQGDLLGTTVMFKASN